MNRRFHLWYIFDFNNDNGKRWTMDQWAQRKFEFLQFFVLDDKNKTAITIYTLVVGNRCSIRIMREARLPRFIETSNLNYYWWINERKPSFQFSTGDKRPKSKEPFLLLWESNRMTEFGTFRCFAFVFLICYYVQLQITSFYQWKVRIGLMFRFNSVRCIVHDDTFERLWFQ